MYSRYESVAKSVVSASAAQYIKALTDHYLWTDIDLACMKNVDEAPC